MFVPVPPSSRRLPRLNQHERRFPLPFPFQRSRAHARRSTPLVLAVQQGHTEAARVLIEAGAAIDVVPRAEDGSERAPSLARLAADMGRADLVSLLAKALIDRDSAETLAAVWAAASSTVEPPGAGSTAARPAEEASAGASAEASVEANEEPSCEPAVEAAVEDIPAVTEPEPSTSEKAIAEPATAAAAKEVEPGAVDTWCRDGRR